MFLLHSPAADTRSIRTGLVDETITCVEIKRSCQIMSGKCAKSFEQIRIIRVAFSLCFQSHAIKVFLLTSYIHSYIHRLNFFYVLSTHHVFRSCSPMCIDIETDRTILAGSISYDELLLVCVRLSTYVLDHFVRFYFTGLYFVISSMSIDFIFFLERLTSFFHIIYEYIIIITYFKLVTYLYIY